MRRSKDAIRTVRSWLESSSGGGTSRAAWGKRWPTGVWAGGGLIILCLLVYVPGLWTIPPVDRDESRFAQASRQMLESGTLEGWVVPRVQDKPRLNKPPLIYWLQASSAAVLGDRPGQWTWLDGGSENIWVYRVPSVLSAIAAVLLTWRLGVRMFDPRAAWLGAAFLAICPMVVWDAHQARADQLLLATTTGTMLALWCVWSGRKTHRGDAETRRVTRWSGLGWAIAFWVALALGIMTKGPITPMIAALTCVALSVVSRQWRWMRRLRPILGLLIVAAIVGPWVSLVGQEVGWSKYLSIIYDETIGRSAGAKEGHWGPPGYHIVLLGVLFWPGSLLTAAAIGRAWKRGMRAMPSSPSSLGPPPPPAGEVSRESASVTEGASETSGPATHPLRRTRKASFDTSPAGGGGGAKTLRRFVGGGASLRRLASLRPSRPAELFLLAWMLPAWVVFELISTKLPHYTMPLYPAVALISAAAVIEAIDRQRKAGAGEWLWLLIGVAATAFAGVLIVPHVTLDPVAFGPLLGSILLLLVGWRLVRAGVQLARGRMDGAQLESIPAAGLLMVALGGVGLPRGVTVTRDVMAARRAIDPAGERPFATLGYHEDSMVFASRGRVQRINADALPQWIRSNPDGIVVVPVEVADRSGLSTRDAAVVEGLNYSKGERVRLLVIDLRNNSPL